MSLRMPHTTPSTVGWVPWPIDRSNISVRLPPRVHGSRKFAMASKGHNTGIVVDPNDFTAKACESGIEYNTMLVATADTTIDSITCQAPPVEFVDADGVVHTTVFDFLFGLTTGATDAVMVKSADKARSANVDAQAADLAAQLPDGFADNVVLVTNEDLPAWLVSNARLIHSARLDPPCEYDALIAARAAEMAYPVTIAELTAPWAPRRPRSVARLIYQGLLRQVQPGLIEPSTLVVRNRVD